MTIDTSYLDADGDNVKPARPSLLQAVQAINELESSGTIGDFHVLGIGTTERDLGLDENATHTFAVANFTALTNATVTAAGNTIEIVKTGVGASAGTAAGFLTVPQNADWILYLKLKLSSGAAGNAAHFALGPSGSPSMSLSIGYDWVAGAASAGCISVIWGATAAVIQTGADYVTDYVYPVVVYDDDFTGITIYTKNPTTGEFTYRARVNGAFTYTQEARVTFAGTAATGLKLTMGSVRQLCRPNFMAIGDSICRGATLFDPDPGNGTKNFASCWQSYVHLTEVENTFIVNKGIGGEDSSQINARIATDILPNKPKRVALHLSSNDYSSGITVPQRTTWTQSSIDLMREKNIEVTLLSAVYPNLNVTNYPDNTNLYRGYMTDADGFEQLTGYSEFIDFMTDAVGDPATNNELNVAYAQSDGIHPTPAGYALIGELIRAAWAGETTPRLKRHMEVPGSLFVRGLIHGQFSNRRPFGWKALLYTDAASPKWTINASSGNDEDFAISSLEDGATSDEVYIHFRRSDVVPGTFLNFGTTGAFLGVARLVSIATVTANEDYKARYVIRKLSDGSTPTGADLNSMQFFVRY